MKKDDCTSVRITKIPNIHRALGISVDSEGLNLACLQVISYTCICIVKPILTNEIIQFNLGYDHPCYELGLTFIEPIGKNFLC